MNEDAVEEEEEEERDSKETRLTLMEEVLLLGLKDKVRERQPWKTSSMISAVARTVSTRSA